jgi:tetratricopeptide (TPR) repeat protein
MLDLPSVTLVCLDCERQALALAALEQSMTRCRFAEVMFFTDRDLGIEELEVIPNFTATTREQRFDFIAHRLASHVSTPHLLLIQWDAFVVNPAAWTDEFLAFDFVAPPASPRAAEDANEGIALLSTRLLRALERFADLPSRWDAAVERITHSDAGSGAELRLAPPALGKRFAFADAPPSGQPFGFQGLYNMWMVFQAADLEAFLRMATSGVLRSEAAVSLAVNLRELDRNEESRRLSDAILRAHPDHPLAGVLAVRSRSTVEPSAAVPRKNVGRNDPCPCGSGLRYKACHGALGSNVPAMAQPAAPVSPPAAWPTVDYRPLGNAAVRFNRAQAMLERNDLAGAEKIYRGILDDDPASAVAIEYLGVIATRLHRLDEAESLLLRALERDDGAPEFHNNLGLLRHQQNRFDDARECYRRALELSPRYAPAYNNLGVSLMELQRVDLAIDAYDTAARLQPDFAEAHWNLGLSLILTGDYERGFAEHEWRKKVVQHRHWWSARQQFPEWTGGPVAGKRVLILAEQGMGDMIHFVRYADMLAARGATVIVEGAVELLELLRTVPGVSEVVQLGGPYPRCDLQVAVLSLPYRFNTRPDTIPANTPYLRVDPARIERWQRILGPRDRPRIGVAWAGNPDHARDRFRSAPLTAFAPLAADDRYEWISLQKGPAAEQIASLPPGCSMRDMGRHSETFADLAALISMLDLTVTVDTSVVHIAGALDKPALLLLDPGSDWRWPRSGDTVRWYPSVRIVRQPERGDWAGAIRLAASEIQRFAAG